MKTIFFALIALILTSCMVTKTQSGTYTEDPGEVYTYSKARQLYLFWGFIPLGHASANTPASGSCEVITRKGVGDCIITVITGGILSSQTIKVKAKRVNTN